MGWNIRDEKLNGVDYVKCICGFSAILKRIKQLRKYK
jgi:hypothetical protein